MAKQRDLTESQFKQKLKQYGFGDVTYMGYVRLPNSATSVSLLNAHSDRYRAMLAYLLKESAREQKRQAKECSNA
jgi:hypothetical protein